MRAQTTEGISHRYTKSVHFRDTAPEHTRELVLTGTHGTVRSIVLAETKFVLNGIFYALRANARQ